MSEGLSICIGVVAGLHGVRGELRVKVLTDFPSASPAMRSSG